MNDEIKQLLLDIQNYMMNNDFECGEEGSEIYERISKVLKENE